MQFLGGAETVTGSRTLVSYRGRKILVDCGLFQGLKNLRLRNWEPFPIPPREIDAVLLTHAHLDHAGYLPKLVKEGFAGTIYATPPTVALSRILLADSAFLMEEEARYLNDRKLSRHRPALPLYTTGDVDRVFPRFARVELHTRIRLADGIDFEFLPAGHILGAAMIVLNVGDRKIIFSGDIGRMKDPIFNPPAVLPDADALVLESTYGNRPHGDTDVLAELERLIRKVHARGGVILVPAFAVGRAQLLMHLLSVLKDQGRLPEMPMYLNSPMATRATDLLMEFRSYHRLTPDECKKTCDVVTYVDSVEESIALNRKTGPLLIISASGMITGGRILHHVKAFGSDPRNMILLTGFQAAGTRGRALLDGATELKIHGAYVPVRAEVALMDSLSAHADARETIDWLRQSSNLHPRQVFLNHGEPAASDELRRRLNEAFGWDCVVAEPGKNVVLE